MSATVGKRVNYADIRVCLLIQQNISIEKFHQLFEGLKTNTHLSSLTMANTRMTDTAAKVRGGHFRKVIG